MGIVAQAFHVVTFLRWAILLLNVLGLHSFMSDAPMFFYFSFMDGGVVGVAICVFLGMPHYILLTQSEGVPD